MAGHVAGMGGSETYEVLEGKVRERKHLEDPELDRRIILKWIVRRLDGSGFHVLD